MNYTECLLKSGPLERMPSGTICRRLYEANLPEVQSELLPGTETEGIIVYPALDLDEPKLQFYAEGYSSDHEISIDPFVFEIQND